MQAYRKPYALFLPSLCTLASCCVSEGRYSSLRWNCVFFHLANHWGPQGRGTSGCCRWTQWAQRDGAAGLLFTCPTALAWPRGVVTGRQNKGQLSSHIYSNNMAGEGLSTELYSQEKNISYCQRPTHSFLPTQHSMQQEAPHLPSAF